MKQQQPYCNGIQSLVQSALMTNSPVESETLVPPQQQQHHQQQMEFEDPQTEEVASFLLSLKHSRSVSPEPHDESFSTRDHPSVVETLCVESLSFSSYPSPAPYSEECFMEAPFTPEMTPRVRVPPSTSTSSSPDVDSTTTTTTTTNEVYDFATLLDGSSLVKLEDRDLVPDALFIAMAQMKVCHLTQADRVGCYKTREIGFVGMCCKHCGGQPGFGRYYPNSVRSLAQTTTSQTILKHIGGKCRYAPAAVRTAVLEMQKEQAAQEGLVSGRPRYGSRKVFFQRVWVRLHGIKGGRRGDAMMTIDDDVVSKVSSSSNSILGHSDTDDRSLMSGHSVEIEQHHHYNYHQQQQNYQHNNNDEQKRKNRFGALPLYQSKRIKVDGPTYDV